MAKTGIEKVFGNRWVQLGALVAGGLALMRTWKKKSVSGIGGVLWEYALKECAEKGIDLSKDYFAQPNWVLSEIGEMQRRFGYRQSASSKAMGRNARQSFYYALQSRYYKGVSGIGTTKQTRKIGAVTVHPAVYVGTYRKYNNGSLFGEWVDLTKFDTYQDFMRYIRNLHKDESDPEFMMQDFEGYPRSLYYESGMDEDTFNAIKEYWNAFDGDDVKRQAYEELLNYRGDDLSVEEFDERYEGTFDSEYDYIDEMIEQGVLDPKYMYDQWGSWVIDRDAIWRFLDTGGDITSVSTDYGIAVFTGN